MKRFLLTSWKMFPTKSFLLIEVFLLKVSRSLNFPGARSWMGGSKHAGCNRGFGAKPHPCFFLPRGAKYFQGGGVVEVTFPLKPEAGGPPPKKRARGKRKLRLLYALASCNLLN
jgi:hypothetical protein